MFMETEIIPKGPTNMSAMRPAPNLPNATVHPRTAPQHLATATQVKQQCSAPDSTEKRTQNQFKIFSQINA